MKLEAALILLALFPASPSPGAAGSKVLVFTKTLVYIHESIPAGITAVKELGAQNGFAVEQTEDASWFRDDSLAKYAAVVFLNNCSDILDTAQMGAFHRFIKKGKGYAGVHCASDVNNQDPFYTSLVGAVFSHHSDTTQGISGTVKVMTRDHPSTKDLPGLWTRNDEWYAWKPSPVPIWKDPANNVQILVTLVEHMANGVIVKDDYPLSWCHSYEGGRAWYTAMGHKAEHYSDPNYRKHLLGGILYAIGAPPVGLAERPVRKPAWELGTMLDLLGRRIVTSPTKSKHVMKVHKTR